MNLLVIGNGLDLDLGLPTKYTDFLNFSKAFIFFLNQDIDKISEFDIHNHSIIDNRYNKNSGSPNLIAPYEKWKKILERFDKIFSHKFINKACKDLFYCIYRNYWIVYFNERYEQNMITGENWIDIENEIQNVIHSIESKRNFEVVANPNTNSSFNAQTFSFNIQSFMRENKTKNRIFEDYYKQVKITLLKDFDKFVMALGIYLDFFVSQLPLDVEHSSQQLRNMLLGENHPTIDHVLSFNYINNFTNKASLQHTCFVHGKINYMAELEQYISDNISNDDKIAAKIENIISRNKIIIGFDDLQNDEENFELEFVDYRKYFQRIYKGTDSQYVDWFNEYLSEVNFQSKMKLAQSRTQNQNLTKEEMYQKLLQEKLTTIPNSVFIFGHSLDATDNEIFKDIFLRELNDTKVTIYYHDSDARKRIITNLIKILTKPILVQKTKGKNPDIKFVSQTYTLY